MENDVRLGGVLGQGISVLVANGRHFFPYNGQLRVQGIIGYQVFSRFVVTLDYQNQQIILTEPDHYHPPVGYTSLHLTLKDTKPYVKLAYHSSDAKSLKGYFHIDTGSSRDVLLFLKSQGEIKNKSLTSADVGKGINGTISGYKRQNDPITISELNAQAEYFIVKREFSRKEIQNAEGSIGSGLLKNYVVVLDYVNQKFYFKRNT